MTQKYDKDEIKEKLTVDMVFDIVQEFGGDPHMTSFGFISATICHNPPGQGSHKLYYYENTKLFKCYTGCDEYFDIFELLMKIKLLAQPDSSWGLYNSVCWVAARYGWGPTIAEEDGVPNLIGWEIFKKYEKFENVNAGPQIATLDEFDPSILNNLAYPIIDEWLEEGITQEVMERNLIGYYPTGEQITIPHFDVNGRFIGLRGRALGEEEADMYGKYRPLIIGKQMYNHPLGLNLYNFNNSKSNIERIKKAVVFEGEKSCLLYQSYFGANADISVACCGSSISTVQMTMLLNSGAEEVIIAFDKQFQEVGDAEFKLLVRNLRNIHKKYSPFTTISFLFDKEDKMPYKASPIDCGAETFIEMYKNRILL